MASGSSETPAPFEPTGFWSRARVAFYSTVINLKHGELLQIEERNTPDELSEVGKDGPGDNEKHTTEPERFVNEQREYSQSMRDTWLLFLHEEITLLKVERQNEFLTQAQDQFGSVPTRSKNPSKGPVWAKLPAASPPPPATGAQNRAPPSLSKVVSVRTVRTRPSVAGSEEAPRGSAAQLTPVRKRGPLMSSSTMKAAAVIPASKSNPLQPSELLNKLESGAERSVSSREVLKGRKSGRRRRAISGLPEGVGKLEEPARPKAPASSAQRKAQRAVLERNESGISAATAAAEAAHVGGNRIRSMWSKMKTALGGRSKDKSGPRKPDMDALSSAVRGGQLPSERRGSAWLALALQDAPDIEDARLRYRSFVAHKLDQDPEIKRDINRTFPEHPLFQEEDGPGQRALFNVMKAYAAYDPEVGYCQGMAFVAAVLLMHIGEADAFAVLIHFTYRCGFRATFLPNMDQLQARLYQLTQLVQEALPELDAHMEELGIRPVMYAAPWFLTVFANTLPLPLVFRTFDVVLAERSSAIVFKTALVLLQVSLRQLLQCTEMEHFVHFLRTELSLQLQSLPREDLDEIPAKALRIGLPFESMLRLEAEYELLAEEAATAVNEIDAAADASRAAAEAWEKARAELEARLAFALKAQARAEAQLASCLQQKGHLTNDDMMGGNATNQELGLWKEADSTSVLDGPATPKTGQHVSMASCIIESAHLQQNHHGDSRLDALSSGEDSADENVRHIPSVVLLRKVMALRQEKHTIGGSLKRAENALQEAVRLENRRFGLEKDGAIAKSGRPMHLRLASWTASPLARLQSN